MEISVWSWDTCRDVKDAGQAAGSGEVELSRSPDLTEEEYRERSAGFTMASSGLSSLS